jgi:hypothetical protein
VYQVFDNKPYIDHPHCTNCRALFLDRLFERVLEPLEECLLENL